MSLGALHFAHLAPATPFGVKDFLDHNPMVGEARVGPRRFWTTTEERILREAYPSGGLAGALPLLPGRTASSIYGRARFLGLKSPQAAKSDFRVKKWTTTEAIDHVIRRAYQTTPTAGAIKRMAVTVGRPRWWVTRRASTLGLYTPRFKAPDWTEPEIELVSANAFKNYLTISKLLRKRGFARSATAVANQIKRWECSRDDPNHFTAGGLARLMGVDPKVVSGWVLKGWLKARRRGTERTPQQGGDQWWIRRADVRRFVIDNAAAVDIRKVDRFWFIDLLARPA